MFLCSELPCLGWRSADFLQVFFCQNCFWTSANLLLLNSTKISMATTPIDSSCLPSIARRRLMFAVSFSAACRNENILSKCLPFKLFLVAAAVEEVKRQQREVLHTKRSLGSSIG
jgi:hypothetical protein